ncbi:MAG TPA: site-2 protease family protein [Pirellulales bacterium]|nr:site-2 protease family protein [Pirellulales bacterium]
MDYYSDDIFDGRLDSSERGPLLVQTLPVAGDERPAPAGRQVLLPAALFVATCLSTYHVGGLAYAVPVMLILTTHELGHFFQALRYRVPASLPFFIPMPVPPVGTMGAVIGMQAHVGDRKALYDIGITGPLAGLVPAIICSIVGLQWSHVEIVNHGAAEHVKFISLGEPLLFKLLSHLTFGPLNEGQDVILHPLAFAGWVGIFITGLNLIPIGQLDGGHVLYALLLRRAHRIALFLIFAATFAMFVFQYWGWSLMLMLLFWTGPRHPPTADDGVPLGRGRIVLGWLTLAFVLIGFTPEPFNFGNP